MVETENQNVVSAPKKNNPIGFYILGALVIALIVMIGVWMNKNSQVTRLEVGHPVPDFSITSFDNQAYNLSEYKGKVVLVNFWASWCATCDEEGYMLEEVWNEVQPGGQHLFLGVDYVDTQDPALKFISSHGVTYPNGPDLGANISKMFNITGVPETFLIGKDGTLKAIQIGAFASADDLRAFLAKADN
ncbi:MAG: TlpA family protein disulfide reductase [Anaerolineae bacterium]|nr:TlpA family protein disulfide reductase [Anaerolineae bacterium]